MQMAIRQSVLGMLSTTAVLSVLALHSPAHAQSSGREAQIVVDAETNEVLYENNARDLRRPASITKVMTLYLLFDALEKGQISWDDRIAFSRNAAAQPPTKLFVGAGNSISVQTAIEALVLRSANDVATAVAERLGGSEGNFAQMMTSKARELGMSNSTFRNASGLPDSGQRSTAEDLARLAIAIHRDFPSQYHWFSARQMTYNGQTITGHNHLMSRMQGMDGLKTGFTRASGFNLAATTSRNGRRVVTVVLGGPNRFVRDDLVEALTESAYRELGIGATQFAMNPSGYQINFRDSRDAADAAALIMDLPPRSVTTGGATTAIAMNRTGRRLGFERGPPAFQVADMTRPTQRWPTTFPSPSAAAREDGEDSATDEGEDETPVRSAAPNPVPVPFRVAVAPSSATPVRVPPVTPNRGVPVVFPNATPVPVPVPVPLRQMAEAQMPTPSTASAPQSPLVVLPPNPTGAPTSEARPPIVVFPAEASGGLRGSTDAPNAPKSDTVEAAPTQSPPSQTPEADAQAVPAAVPTQMAELLNPPAPVAIEAPVEAPVQVAEMTPAPEASPPQSAPAPDSAPIQTANSTEQPVAIPTQMAELAQQDAASLSSDNTASSESAPTTNVTDVTGSVNLADASAAAGGLVTAPTVSEAHAAAQTEAVTESATQAAARQAAEAVALNQARQAEASAREQARLDAATAIEEAAEARRREAARAARQLAERQAIERRAAERLVAETRAREQREKAAREQLLAEREAAKERAVAAQAEERRQAEATRARNARGSAVVQVGAFKDKDDADDALARFARFFPTFAQREVTTITRRDGTWYRARFSGLGTIAAREACTTVLGRGGVCAIVGD
jgi:D-alanyl-D-alanine carboxypeptidase